MENSEMLVLYKTCFALQYKKQAINIGQKISNVSLTCSRCVTHEFICISMCYSYICIARSKPVNMRSEVHSLDFFVTFPWSF